MEVLGYEFSSFDLVKYKNPPKLTVKRWSSISGDESSIALNPKYESNQHFFTNVASTEDRAFSWYNEQDFQELADEFNNDEDLPFLWKNARKEAFRELIGYYQRQLKEAENTIPRYEEELRKLEELD